MAIEDLRRQNFTLSQIDYYERQRALFPIRTTVDGKTLEIKQEITYFSKGKEPLRLVTYEIRVEGISPTLPEKEKWELLEEELDTLPRTTPIDEAEKERLTKSFVRSFTLHRLGFTPDNMSGKLAANWQEETDKDMHFEFVESPKVKNLFLVRSIITDPNDNNSSTVLENLVFAPDKETLKSFWKDTIERERQTIPNH